MCFIKYQSLTIGGSGGEGGYNPWPEEKGGKKFLYLNRQSFFPNIFNSRPSLSPYFPPPLIKVKHMDPRIFTKFAQACGRMFKQFISQTHAINIHLMSTVYCKTKCIEVLICKKFLLSFKIERVGDIISPFVRLGKFSKWQ